MIRDYGPATDGGLPPGFRSSNDPNGFIVQFWIGHRNPRTLPPPPNVAPTVSVSASSCVNHVAVSAEEPVLTPAHQAQARSVDLDRELQRIRTTTRCSTRGQSPVERLPATAERNLGSLGCQSGNLHGNS